MDSKKLIPFFVLLGFVSGLAGGFVSQNFLPFKLGTAGAQEVSTQQAVQQKTYVEESQAIDATKKAGASVVSIVATEDLKIYNSQPNSYSNNPFNDPFFFNFPGFRQQMPQQNQQNQQGQQNNGANSNDYQVQKQKIGGGSGFIISGDGLVLTNRHVISDQNVQYTIISNDGTEYDGEVVSVDPFSDIAVLQMVKSGELSKKKDERSKLSGLPVIDFGDSSLLQPGQKVLAIGYALGQYENTVTEGIISGKGREITAEDPTRGPETLSGLLQTDAAINPGNSGGPLVNLSGQVVGVNVAIDQTGSNIGFAIPINDVKPVLESIKKYGRIVRATLGVRHILLTKEKAKELKIDVDHGALLVGDEANGEFAVIPGSAADKAGLKIKDVIMSVDGKDITQNYTLQDSIMAKQPGDNVSMKVWRSGQVIDVTATLTEAKDEAVAIRAKA